MPRLSSPDPQIDALLASSAVLQTALQAFIDEGKFVSRRILPGFWQKFLASPHGQKWATEEEGPLPETDVVPAIVPPITDVTCEQCGRVFPTTTSAIRCRLCLGADKRTLPLPVPIPPADDLFDLLARGLQDRLKPTTLTLDEDRVRQLIDDALQKEALHKTHRIIVKKGNEVVQRVDS